MRKQCEINKKAWNYRSYEWWCIQNGTPEEAAKSMINDPYKWLKRHLRFMGEVKDKRVGNLLGSCGIKAVPLALLGADVTIVDISEENRKYALELAREAKVEINYIISDLLEFDTKSFSNYFDILYLEGGILHYFDDLNLLSKIFMKILKEGGKLVLNDAHPIHKILVNKEDGMLIENGDYGNYFSDELVFGNVAYKDQFPKNEQSDFPDCFLRYYTMGEIITAIARSGLIINELDENPRRDNKNIPINFTLIARKGKVID